MDINFADAIIILIILLGGVIGFKEGAIKKITSVVGLILVVVLSFVFKDKLSDIFYQVFPFFRFKGITSLNIIIYELLAFILIATVLFIIYKILLIITGIIEKILKATVILSIPSKIIGFFIGLVENYIWLVIILFIVNALTINLENIGIRESKMVNILMKNTPIVSKYTSNIIDAYEDVHQVIEENKGKDSNEINENVLDVLLKYNIVSVDSLDKVLEMKKIEINNSSFIDKYR